MNIEGGDAWTDLGDGILVRQSRAFAMNSVVLASAEVKFLGPVVVGDRVEAEATVERSEGRKRWVKAVVRREGKPVLEAELLAVVPDRHILDTRG